MIVRDGDNMTCIFHFLPLKFVNFHYLEIEQKDKIIMFLRISFDQYMILIRFFPFSILYNFEKEKNNFEIFKISKWM